MYTYTKTFAAATISTRDKFGQEHHMHFPKRTITVAPLLERIHTDMWGDFGPLVISWKHGWLCPFHPNIDRQRMTCSDGLRNSSFCTGIRLTERYVSHLHEQQRLFLKDRVQCPNWCYRLGSAYWDIPTDRLLHMPDEPDFVYIWILNQVYQMSGWDEWQACSLDSKLQRPKPLERHFCRHLDHNSA